MKTLPSAVICCLLICGAASAQHYEAGVMGGYSRTSRTGIGSVSSVDPAEGDTKLKSNYTTGLWVALNTKGYYGVELAYKTTPLDVTSVTRTTDDSDVTTEKTARDRIMQRQIMANFLCYFMPRGEKWRPFVTAGIQRAQYHEPHISSDWPSGKVKHYGANFGVGMKFQPVKHILFRIDAREYWQGKPYGLDQMNSGTFRQFEATAGFGIGF